MKKILKWLAGTLTALVAIIVLIAITLPILLDPNRYRQEIADLVHKETGLYLNINGKIDWSVFPWVGLSINDVVVDDINKQKLASLHNVAVSVKLMPLLSKQIQVSDLKLDGVDLNLLVAKNGTPNWLPASKPVTRTATSGAETAAPDAVATGTNSSFSLQDLSVASIAISDINVSYRDERNNQSIVIKNAQLHTGAFAFGKPFQLTASLDLENQSPAIKANVAFTAMMNSMPDKGTYTIEQLDLTVTPNGVENPARIELKGNLALKERTITGKIELAPLDLFTAMSQLNVALPRFTGGDTVLRKVSIGTNLKAKNNSIALNNMFAIIDKNELKGSFDITNLKDMAIRFNLTGSDIVVDPYLPVADPAAVPAATMTPATKASAPAQKTGSANPVIIPVDTLKALNIHGKAVLKSLTVKGFLFQKPTLEVMAQNGDVRLTKLNAGFYEGKISAAAGINVAGAQATNPRISAAVGINGINIPALATQIPDLADITGTVNANAKVLSHGLTQSQIISGLNGDIDFQIAQGALLGVNFNQLLCSVIARVRKEESTRADWPTQTDFTQLGGTARIVDGVIYNKDLAAALATVNLKGSGDVNLMNQSINYHIGLTVTGNSVDEQDNACRINKRYANITWPMVCRGKLGQPGLCGIDERRLVNIAADLVGASLKDKFQKELSDKLGDKLQGFEGLLNNLKK